MAGLVFLGLMRGSGEIPNGFGMAQLCPILKAPSMRPVAHNTLKRWRDRLAAFAAWAIEMYLSMGLVLWMRGEVFSRQTLKHTNQLLH